MDTNQSEWTSQLAWMLTTHDGLKIEPEAYHRSHLLCAQRITQGDMGKN